ncbi:MAG: hypothetical protein R6X32_04195 [Chloroflexota bacterium]|jgi:hypothetical protein
MSTTNRSIAQSTQKTQRLSLAGALLGLASAIFIVVNTNRTDWFEIVLALLHYAFWGGVIGNNLADKEKRPLIIIMGIGCSLFFFGLGNLGNLPVGHWHIVANGLIIGGLLGSAPDIARQTLKEAIKPSAVVGLGFGLITSALFIIGTMNTINNPITAVLLSFIIVILFNLFGVVIITLTLVSIWVVTVVVFHFLFTHIGNLFLKNQVSP